MVVEFMKSPRLDVLKKTLRLMNAGKRPRAKRPGTRVLPSGAESSGGYSPISDRMRVAKPSKNPIGTVLHESGHRTRRKKALAMKGSWKDHGGWPTIIKEEIGANKAAIKALKQGGASKRYIRDYKKTANKGMGVYRRAWFNEEAPARVAADFVGKTDRFPSLNVAKKILRDNKMMRKKNVDLSAIVDIRSIDMDLTHLHLLEAKLDDRFEFALAPHVKKWLEKSRQKGVQPHNRHGKISEGGQGVPVPPKATDVSGMQAAGAAKRKRELADIAARKKKGTYRPPKQSSYGILEAKLDDRFEFAKIPKFKGKKPRGARRTMEVKPGDLELYRKMRAKAIAAGKPVDKPLLKKNRK